MKQVRALCLAFLVGITPNSLWSQSLASAPGTPTEFAVTEVNVIPMHRGGILAGQTVVVRGGRIAAMGPSASTTVPAGMHRVDGRGKWLIPGLIDMHAHAQPGAGNIGDPAGNQLTMYLAHGVTTMRSLAGAPTALQVRDRVARGEVLGPVMLVYSPSLNAGSVPYASAVGALVAGHKRAGFDGLKVHGGFSAEVYDSIIAAARREAMPVSGHVTPGYGLARAVAAGQQVEHLDGILDAITTAGYTGPPLGQQVYNAAMLDAVDTTRLDALARAHATAGIWHGPTMALFKTMTSDSSTEQLLTRPVMRYVATAQAAQQANGRRQREANVPLEARQRFQRLRDATLRALHRHGVKLLAGSDTPSELIYVGDGMHRELEAFVEAGLPARAALEAATINPATFLGRETDVGGIAVGMRADLLLLDGNPLDDIRQIRRVRGVSVGGRWLDRVRIDALLDAVATSVNP